MKKYLYLLVVIALVGLILVGCSNPKSKLGFGPSWDVGLRIPLVNKQTTTVQEILGDNSELDLSGDLVRFKQTEVLEAVDLGSAITNLDFPTTITPFDVQLLPITIENVLAITNNDIVLNSGMTGGSANTSIGLPFNEISFTDASVNQIEIVITPPPGIDIISLTLTLQDGLVDLGSLALGGDVLSGTIDLSNETIGDPITIEIGNIHTSGTGSGKMTIDLNIAQGEVSYISGFNLTSPARLENTVTITDLVSTDFMLRSATFESGQLGLALTPPAGSNLLFAINQLKVGEAEGSSSTNSCNINLTGRTIGFTDSNSNGVFDLELSYQIDVSGTNITYNAAESIEIAGGFSADTTVEKVSGVFEQVSLADVMGSFTNPVIENLTIPEEIDQIELNDLIVSLIIDNQTGDPEDTVAQGLSANLGELRFVPRDNNGNIIADRVLVLKDIDLNNNMISRGENRISLVNNDAPLDFIDLIKAKPASIEVVLVDSDGDPDNDITLGDSSSEVAVSKTSLFNTSVQLDLGFNLTLKDPQEIKADPQTIERLDADSKAMIDNGLQSCRLFIEKLDNQLPINVELILYLASVANADLLSKQELE
ncbi:MAG: hypothetical protein MI740_16560, partial [Halanaerobiales bacterium]|nr:hypothetical protein [Halanaerobiales bacterium]